MPSYIVNEPTPSVPSGGFTHSGRGGAGNMYQPSTAPRSARPVHVPRQSARFYSGIGGAGNAHGAGERQSLSFEDDFRRAKARDTAITGHVGVGGAGNVFRKNGASTESDDSSTRRLSDESVGFWGRMSMGSMTKH